MKRLAASLLLSGAGVAAGLAAPAQAQDYPTHPVKLVVPFAPGGGNDVFARLLAQRLSEAWKQQVIVDNRAGAGGNIGSEQVARSAPDGYTLLLGHTGSLAINPSLYTKLPFDPQKDLAPPALRAGPYLLQSGTQAAAPSGAAYAGLGPSHPGGRV